MINSTLKNKLIKTAASNKMQTDPAMASSKSKSAIMEKMPTKMSKPMMESNRLGAGAVSKPSPAMPSPAMPASERIMESSKPAPVKPAPQMMPPTKVDTSSTGSKMSDTKSIAPQRKPAEPVKPAFDATGFTSRPLERSNIDFSKQRKQGQNKKTRLVTKYKSPSARMLKRIKDNYDSVKLV